MATPRTRDRVSYVRAGLESWPSWTAPITLGSYRDMITGFQNGVPVNFGWGQPYSPVGYIPDQSFSSFEHTVDELHGKPVKDPRTGKSWYRTGGPFLNVRVTSGYPVGGVSEVGSIFNWNNTRRYDGGFMTPHLSAWGGGGFSASFNPYDNSFLPDVAAYFDRAWRRAKPKLELSSLYVFLRELKDTIPMLKTTAHLMGAEWRNTVGKTTTQSAMTDYGSQLVTFRGSNISSYKMGPRDIADQFLNHQFGWAPFIGDILSFGNAYFDAAATIKRITDENGKWVRRRAKVVKDENFRIIYEENPAYNSTSYNIPCFPNNMSSEFFASPPFWRCTETERLSVSAAGKFRFYRPEFDVTLPDYTSAWNKVLRYIKIYGLEVNPHHIWQATPWTWLVDWVSNLGDYIERLSDTLEDQVAAEYFYVTARKSVVRKLEISLPLHSGLRVLTFERKFESKQRSSADSPYGFNLTWDNLSPRRLAILASLGISRNTGVARR